MIVAMYWLLFFLTLEAYFGVFSFKRKGRLEKTMLLRKSVIQLLF